MSGLVVVMGRAPALVCVPALKAIPRMPYNLSYRVAVEEQIGVKKGQRDLFDALPIIIGPTSARMKYDVPFSHRLSKPRQLSRVLL